VHAHDNAVELGDYFPDVVKEPKAIMIQRGNDIVYINATSTHVCSLAPFLVTAILRNPFIATEPPLKEFFGFKGLSSKWLNLIDK